MVFKTPGNAFEVNLTSAFKSLVNLLTEMFDSFQIKIEEEKNREAIVRLLALEDFQLQDMGISRDDVRSALKQPLDKSSGKLLETVRRRNSRMI